MLRALPRLSGDWGRARQTSEKRERGMMGTNVERERGVIVSARRRRLRKRHLKREFALPQT